MNYKKLIKKAELLYNNGLIDESIDMYDKSVEKVAKIPQHSYRGRAILVILESLNRKKLPNDKASSLFKKLIKVVEGISSDYYKSRALVEIINASSDKGLLDKAVKITEKMTYDYHKSEVLFEIVKKLWKMKLMDEAIILCKSISHDYYKSKALVEIVGKLCNKKSINKAIELYNLIPNSRPYGKSEALYKISKYFHKQVKYQLGKKHFDKAVKIAESIEGKYWGKYWNPVLLQK